MASKTQDTIKGATTGAVTGATIGSAVPVIGTAWGAGVGGVLGGLGGYLGYMPGTGEGEGDDANNTITAMKQAAGKYDQYRPELMQARMNALNTALGAFSPVNTALGRMYGPEAQFDLSKAAVNPFAVGSSANPGSNAPAAAPPQGAPQGDRSWSDIGKDLATPVMPWHIATDLKKGDYAHAIGGPMTTTRRLAVEGLKKIF